MQNFSFLNILVFVRMLRMFTNTLLLILNFDFFGSLISYAGLYANVNLDVTYNQYTLCCAEIRNSYLTTVLFRL
jgi:hypothetical protein